MRLDSLHCPFCHKHTQVSPAPLGHINDFRRVAICEERTHEYFGFSNQRWWMGVCNGCGRPLLVEGDCRQVLPPPQPSPVSKHVPEPIRSDLAEAKLCFSVGAFNAAATMARRALQACAVAHGAPRGKRLEQQVKWLADESHITRKQKDLADAVRWIGNDGAHDNSADDEPTGVTKDDAKAAIELVEQLFTTMYDAEAMTLAQFNKRGKTPPP